MRQTLYFILYQALKYVFHIYYSLEYYLWSKSTDLAYLLSKLKNERGKYWHHLCYSAARASKIKEENSIRAVVPGNVLGLNLHKLKDNGCNLLRLHDLKYYKHRDPVCTCITGSLRN